jgi:hypothetical protein
MIYNKSKYILAILLIAQFILSVPAAQARVDSQQKFRPSEKAWEGTDKTLRKMTIDEKIGQLVHIGLNASFVNQESKEFKELRRQIVDNKVGGIIVSVGGVCETEHLVNRMQALAKTPLLISVDFGTGRGRVIVGAA